MKDITAKAAIIKAYVREAIAVLVVRSASGTSVSNVQAMLSGPRSEVATCAQNIQGRVGVKWSGRNGHVYDLFV